MIKLKLREWIIDQAKNRFDLKGTDEQNIEFAKVIQMNYFTKEEMEEVS